MFSVLVMSKTGGRLQGLMISTQMKTFSENNILKLNVTSMLIWKGKKWHLTSKRLPFPTVDAS